MKSLQTVLVSLLLVLPSSAYTLGEEHRSSSVRSDEEWIADLASDEVRWNATRAFDRLRSRPPVRLLEKALDSPDYQQRQIAAGLLRRIEEYDNPDDRLLWYPVEYDPPDRLLEVTVEGLQDDLYPRDPVLGTWTSPVNASGGVPFLVKHAEAAERYLIAGLDSRDHQQRFLCAYILGINGIKDQLPAVASILIPHLRDNDIRQDACMACSALYHLGEEVRPYLLDAIPDADTQQEETIHLILADLEHPPSTSEELAKRRRIQSISRSVYDPALQYEVLEFDFPSGKEDLDKALTE